MTDTATETELLETVQFAESVDSADEARTAVEVTLETLGERIGDGQADDLAATLPTVAADPLQSASPDEAEPFTLPVFLERVGKRSEIDADPVELARAVVAGLRETADETEFERTREQLPAEYDLVFDPGEQLPEDESLAIVADELPDGVDADDARDVTRAVVSAIRESAADAEFENVRSQLPAAYDPPFGDQ